MASTQPTDALPLNRAAWLAGYGLTLHWLTKGNRLKNLRIATTVLALLGMAGISFAQTTIEDKTMIKSPHPRVLLLPGEEFQIQQAMVREPTLKKMHEAILQACDAILQ